MGIQTNYLKLIKPVAGSANWGNAINQNLDKIDLGYAKLTNNLQNIEGRLKETGTFSFIQVLDGNTIREIDYMQIRGGILRANDTYYQILDGEAPNKGTESPLNGIYYYTTDQLKELASNEDLEDLYDIAQGAVVLGALDSDNSFEQETKFDSYNKIFYNDEDTSHTQIYDIQDYRAFYIDVPYILIEDSPTAIASTAYAFGQEWNNGAIAVKTSDTVDNIVTPIISRFKQVLGGYYVPSSTLEQPNTITFTKVSATNALSQTEIYIPRNVYNAVETTVQLTSDHINNGYDTNQYLITTIEEVRYYNSIHGIRFFTGSLDNQQFFMVDYQLKQESDKYKIYIDPTYLLGMIQAGQTFYMSYYVMSWQQTE